MPDINEMGTIYRIISEFRNEANIDFIDIPLIIGTIQEELGLKDPQETQACALMVMKGLMERGVYPGDYDNATHISFWSGTPEQMLKRIEAEWLAMGKAPDYDTPICWFGLRPSEPS